MLRQMVSKCSEYPSPAWCRRIAWWLDSFPAATATVSRKASCGVKPGKSGFIFVGSAPFGGRERGSFLEVISLGVPPRFVVTHASWRSRAFFKASAGISALETFRDTTVALMHRSLLAQTT